MTYVDPIVGVTGETAVKRRKQRQAQKTAAQIAQARTARPDLVPDRKAALQMLDQMGFGAYSHRIKAYQRRAGLPVDGHVDRNTMAMIAADHAVFSPIVTRAQAAQRAAEPGVDPATGKARQLVAPPGAASTPAALPFQEWSDAFNSRYGRRPTEEEANAATAQFQNLPAGTIDLASIDDRRMPEVIALNHLQTKDRAFERYREIVDAPQAARVANIKAMWPTLPNQVNVAMARDGKGPDDPNVIKAALVSVRNHVPASDGDTARVARAQKGFLARAASDGREVDLTKSPVWKDMQARAAAQEQSGDSAHDPGDDTLWGAWGVAKGVMREGLSLLQAPYEEAQGQFRNIVSAAGMLSATPEIIAAGPLRARGPGMRAMADPSTFGPDITGTPNFFSPQSALGIQVENLLGGGGPTDLGSGILPSADSPVYREQARRARESLSIAGHAGTPGRLFAYVATEPGSTAYNVFSGLTDAAVATYLDPANVALSKVSSLREATKVFSTKVVKEGIENSGMVNSFLRHVVPQTGEQWVNSPAGRKLTETISKMSGPLDYLRLRKMTGGDAKVAADLWEAQTPEAAGDIIKGVAGTGMRDIPKIPKIRSPFEQARFAQVMPGSYFDPNDTDQMVEQAIRVGYNAKVDPKLINYRAYQLSRATTEGEKFNIITDGVFGDVYDSLVSHKTLASDAKEMTRIWSDRSREAIKYMVDEEGLNRVVPWYMADGIKDRVPQPVMYIDFLNNAFPTGNVREIKRMTSALAPIYNHKLLGGAIGGVAGGAAGAAQAVSEGKTPQQVALEAATGAVAGAAVGAFPREVTDYILDPFMSKIFKPLALVTRIAWPLRVIGEEQIRMAAAGYDSMFKSPLSYIAWITGRKGGLSESDFMEAAMKNDWDTPFGMSMSRHSSSGPQHILDTPDATLRLKDRQNYWRGDKHYVRAWGEELGKAHDDPIVSYLAGHSPEDAKEWFFNFSDGKKLREHLARQGQGWENLEDRGWSDAYVDLLYDHLNLVTGGDKTLLDTVATGKLDGKDIFRVNRRGRTVDPVIHPKLQDFADQDFGPGVVPGDRLTTLSMKPRTGDLTDQITRAFFNGLMGVHTDKLSRSPTFRQAYWNRVVELAPIMDADELAKATTRAVKMGIPKSTVKELERIPGLAPGTENALKVAHVDRLAKAEALATTRHLLYDISERSQFFDGLRLLFPFGEAFKEVTTRWGGLVANHWNIPRRAQQVVQGARGAGFFYQNAYGQEVFNYPLSSQLSDLVVGHPFPLEGQVKGLNLVGNVWPGVGPVMQIPAVWFLPDTPDAQTANDFFFPYGRPAETDPLSLATSAVLPAWSDKLFTFLGTPQFKRNYMNYVMQIDRYKSTTGEYGYSTKELNRRLNDSKSEAQWVSLLHAVGQNVLPAAPQIDYQIYDRSGRLQSAAVMSEKLHALERQNYDTAAAKFVEKYGLDTYAALTPLSRAYTYQLPVTRTGLNWESSHGDIVADYPTSYGFIAPQGGPNEKLDPRALNNQIASGKRWQYEPEIRDRVQNDAAARFIYDKRREALGPEVNWTDEDRNHLSKLHKSLKRDFPGYDSDFGKIGRASSEDIILEFENMVKDPRLKTNRTVQGLRTYLEVRHKVDAEAKEAFGPRADWTRRKDTADLRSQVARVQKAMLKDYPGLSPAFQIVFRNDTANLEEG